MQLTDEQLEALRRLDACTLANAIETFRGRLRNEGFVDHTVRCLFPHLQPMIGYVATQAQALIALCRSPEFTLEKLRAAVAKSAP
jgi:hypothetical protein